VTFAREKRLLLGVAALLVAWPLPFNDALEWPVLALFVALVALALRRAWLGVERWLGDRALNLLGLAYLPVLVLDVATFGRVQLVRPVLHLTLFGVAAKLWSLSRERDKWQAWIGIFFLFLAAMATSVHPAVVLYLAAFVALTVAILARFVYLHILSSFGHRDALPPGLPLGRFVAATAAATLLVAAPLFAILPRVRSPYILSGAPGGPSREPTAGFADEMSLDLIDRIRGNRQVAMRLELSGRHADPETMRFKAATYERWEGRTWRRTRGARTLRRDAKEGTFRIAERPVTGSARILLEPLRITSLPVPVETVAVDAELAMIEVDRGGGLFLKGMPAEVLEYLARLGAEPASAAPAPAGPEDAALDPGGLTERMRALAREWAGAGSDAERARRIEARLLADYRYTLDFIGRGGEAPLEHFLFEARRGHCEYFASSMVLLLRAEGIPARLVTGFYGAEYSWWEKRWVVRQSNAHAWVEAWLADFGWTPLDPTPPVGRPTASPEGVWQSARQAYEALIFRWDRYVLSYDFADQIGLAGELRAFWERLRRAWSQRETPAPSAPAGDAAPVDAAAVEAGSEGAPDWLLPAVIAFALLATVIGMALYRRRGAWSATLAYSRLRDAVAESGVPVAASLAPLAFGAAARRRLPEAAPAVGRLLESYLAESFAGRVLAAAELEATHADLRAVETAVRGLGRGRRGAGVAYSPGPSGAFNSEDSRAR
jgi:transglutaminase-like putative cysteine protease